MIKTPLLGGAMRRLALIASACVSIATSTLSAISVNNNTNNIVVGDYRLGAWTMNFNNGSWHTRSYDNTPGYYRCDLDLKSSTGGYDITIGKNTSGGTKVSAIPISQYASSKIQSKSVTGSGYWWSGYKTIISQYEYYQTLDGQWECYIVETSSLSASALVTRLGYLTYLGQATYDGSNYKHYKGTIPGTTINQMWSIRDNYRDSGYSAVGYIQQKWVSYGVNSNWWQLGWSRYVEFAGLQKGHFEFQSFDMPWNQSKAVQR